MANEKSTKKEVLTEASRRKRKEDSQEIGTVKRCLRSNSSVQQVDSDTIQRKRKRNEVASESKKIPNLPSSSKSITQHKKIKCRKSTKMQLQEQLDDTPDKEFLVDEIVLTTIPGYAPWPSRILSMTGQTIMVEFFGTGEV